MLGTTKDGNLCWLNPSQSSIQCISMLTTFVAQKLSTQQSEPLPDPLEISEKFPIAILSDQPLHPNNTLNWLTDNWYLLDSQAELLYLCDNPLKHCLVIADHAHLSRPLALEIDATEGLLFFARHGDKARFGPQSVGPAIVKMTLDGGQVTTLVDVRLVKPALITLDIQTRKLYWIDTYLSKSIYYSHYFR